MQVNFGAGSWIDQNLISSAFELEQFLLNIPSPTIQSSPPDNLPTFYDVDPDLNELLLIKQDEDGNLRKRKIDDIPNSQDGSTQKRHKWNKEDEAKLINAASENFKKTGRYKFDEIQFNLFPKMKLVCITNKFYKSRGQNEIFERRLQKFKPTDKNEELSKKMSKIQEEQLPNTAIQSLSDGIIQKRHKWNKEDETKLINAVLENFKKTGTVNLNKIKSDLFPNLKSGIVKYKVNSLRHEDVSFENLVQEAKQIHDEKKINDRIDEIRKECLQSIASQNLDHVVWDSMEENNPPFNDNEISEPIASEDLNSNNSIIANTFGVEEFFDL